MTIIIALISPGAMGAAIGGELRRHGAAVRTSLAGRSGASADRARKAGLEIVDNDAALLESTDFVLSVLPPGDAAVLADRLAPAMAKLDRKPVYLDCNAVSPDSAAAIGKVVMASGAAFVDAAIIGPPPDGKVRTVLYVSGPSAPRALALKEYGMDVRVTPGEIGAASALKMSYAGITKGLTGLCAVMLLGATRYGCEAELLKEMSESQPNMLAFLTRTVPQMYGKAYRWVAEMEEVGNFLGEGAAPGIYRSIAAVYEELAAAQRGERNDIDTLDRALAAAPKKA